MYLTTHKSLALGRPPAIHLSYVDCEFPLDEEATLDNAGSNQNGCEYFECFFFFLELTKFSRPDSLENEAYFREGYLLCSRTGDPDR